jgi:hypothetical protein
MISRTVTPLRGVPERGTNYTFDSITASPKACRPVGMRERSAVMC